jgi:hypothetical protein
MPAASDLAHKAFVSLLGVSTVGAGVWLGASMLKGFSFHSAAKKERRAAAGAAVAAAEPAR